jgi:hypothetical protein
MKNLTFLIVLSGLVFLLGCSSQSKKREAPKNEILKAITTFIQNEKGFKSLQDISLIQAEEITLTNHNTLKTKKNYIVWKTLAKVKHICDGCPIQDLENNVAMFIVTEDNLKHFEAHLHVISLKGMNPLQSLMNKPLTEEVETTNRYTHTKGAELNDSEPYIWTNEEYSYPSDIRQTKIAISQIADINIDQKETILDIKGGGISVIWSTKDKILRIIDSYARKDLSLKKGDNPVTFEDYYSFAEGRRIKFQLD